MSNYLFPEKILCEQKTPSGKNTNKMAYDEYYLYGLHRESSPNGYGCSQDTLEVGWGDSPGKKIVLCF